jgi:hypothetical protein
LSPRWTILIAVGDRWCRNHSFDGGRARGGSAFAVSAAGRRLVPRRHHAPLPGREVFESLRFGVAAAARSSPGFLGVAMAAG